MIILHCTNKVLKELGVSKSGLINVREDSNPLSVWYVNLFYLNRQKCLIFTSAYSLFSFVVHGVYRKDIRKIDELFCKELSRALFNENFNAQEMDKVMKVVDEIKFTKTTNRSVLGSMNDRVDHYNYMKSRSIVEGDMDDAAIMSNLNKTPMGSLNYDYPIERFRAMVTGKKVERIDGGQKLEKKKQIAYIFNAQMT